MQGRLRQRPRAHMSEITRQEEILKLLSSLLRRAPKPLSAHDLELSANAERPDLDIGLGEVTQVLARDGHCIRTGHGNDAVWTHNAAGTDGNGNSPHPE